MRTPKTRTKRIVVATVAVVAALGIGGVAWTSAASADVAGSERDRVGAAAVQAVGGGTILDVETSDDPGEAYEAEVRKADGSEVDVTLDKDLKVLNQSAENADDTPDADDRVLTDAQRTSAEQAAVAAVAGTVVEVEASDDPGVAYDIEVRGNDNKDWDVELDSAFQLVRKTVDN